MKEEFNELSEMIHNKMMLIVRKLDECEKNIAQDIRQFIKESKKRQKEFRKEFLL